MPHRNLAAIGLMVCLLAPVPAAAEATSDKGSLLVRIISRADGLPLAKASVEAIDPASLEPDRRTRLREIVILAKAESNEKGWARLESLPAGDVILRILPAGRTMLHVTDPITVHTGLEDVLDDIEVPPPSSLTIHLDLSPSVRKRIEEGIVEAVVLYGSTDRRGAAGFRKETTDPDVQIDEVTPGNWKVMALLRIGRVDTVVDPRGVTVLVPEGTSIDASLAVSSLIFTGKVTLRGKPVKGQMNPFPSEKKEGGFGFAVPFDEDGEFAFPLPEAGLYDLRVFSREPGHTYGIELPKVRFGAAESESPMTIELPEGAIEGVVIDDSGAPVSDVNVAGSRPREKRPPAVLQAKSDLEGRFRLEPLQGGQWTVMASTTDASSTGVVVDLAENATRDGVVLALTQRRAKVSVLDSGGGARPRLLVSATLHRPDGTVSQASGMTDQQGVVGLDLDAREGDFVVMTLKDLEGGACAPALVPFSREMQVRLSGRTGVIGFSRPAGPRFLVDDSGAFLDLHEVFFLGSRGQDKARIEIPAGTWLLIDRPSPAQVEQLYRGLGASTPGAVQVVVPTGGMTEIPAGGE